MGAAGSLTVFVKCLDAVSNLTATVEHVKQNIGWKITVTWNRHPKHNNSIAEYVIYGTTYPDVYAFYNETTVKVSTYSYILR